MSWCVVLLLSLIAFSVNRNIRLIPSKLQTVLEWVIEYVYNYVAETLESKKLATRFFPYLMTIFLFICTSNLIEYFPGIGSIGIYKSVEGHMFEFLPLLRSVNTDLNVTLALAIISFVVIEGVGFATIGTWKYIGKFIDVKHGVIGFAVGLVELIGEFARLISLSFRLFGNILAGEVLIIVATFFLPYLGPIPLMMFELFIGVLQAAIFALLTLFFIKLAIAEPHGAEAH
jgi:F-type H+-transporting ATPase subunit a